MQIDCSCPYSLPVYMYLPLQEMTSQGAAGAGLLHKSRVNWEWLQGRLPSLTRARFHKVWTGLAEQGGDNRVYQESQRRRDQSDASSNQETETKYLQYWANIHAEDKTQITYFSNIAQARIGCPDLNFSWICRPMGRGCMDCGPGPGLLTALRALTYLLVLDTFVAFCLTFTDALKLFQGCFNKKNSGWL